MYSAISPFRAWGTIFRAEDKTQVSCLSHCTISLPTTSPNLYIFKVALFKRQFWIMILSKSNK